jgi:hypothetical protein
MITMIAPIITLTPNITGISSFDALFIRYSEINGDQDPKIRPALYENPAALFRRIVGNLSEKNAGIGPDAVDIIAAYAATKKSKR